MTIDFICDGKPERLPKIGEVLTLHDYLKFRVTGYGDTKEIDSELYQTGKMYKVELEGNYIIPAGSPMDFLEAILGIDGDEENNL